MKDSDSGQPIEWATARAAVAAAEEEQRRLAQTLHDTICQSLSGLYLQFRLCTRRAGRTYPELSPELESLAGMLRQTVDELHGVVKDLRPPEVDGPGLAAALAELARATSASVPCDFAGSAVPPLTPAAAQQLYLITREALWLAIDRAGGTEARIALHGQEEAARLEIAYTGDSPEDDAWALLRNRARLLGAQLTIETGPGRTTVRCLYRCVN